MRTTSNLLAETMISMGQIVRDLEEDVETYKSLRDHAQKEADYIRDEKKGWIKKMVSLENENVELKKKVEQLEIALKEALKNGKEKARKREKPGTARPR